MKILITGGTGLVGTALVKKLRQNGHNVNVLVRKPSDNPEEFFWNYKTNEIDDKALENIDSIIHLAGANIGKRWTKNYKKEIIASRVDSANFLKKKCLERGIRLKSFISASGVNFYGTFTSNTILNEENGVLHHDFLSDVCQKWEVAACEFSEISQRIVILRTAPVLSKKGGSFEQLKKISDMHLASGIGSGKQWFGWIHLDDMVNMYANALENSEINGAYNAVADEIPTNKNFMKLLAKANGKMFLPINVPAFLLKIVLGEMSEIILEGTRTSNEKIKKTGFEFQFPNLDLALVNLLQ